MTDAALFNLAGDEPQNKVTALGAGVTLEPTTGTSSQDPTDELARVLHAEPAQVVAEDEGSGALLPLLRRPAECPPPPVPGRLKSPAAALLGNPRVNLDEAAARTVASGVTDPVKFRAQVNAPERGPLAGVNLLTDKPVVGGTLSATAVHHRYVDDAILPDLRNGRWGHLIHTHTDTHGTLRPAGYHALAGPDGRPLAILTLQLRDRAELAAAVRSSLTQTITAGTSRDARGAANDYTDSVLQQGVKEPVLLFVLRVVYADGTEETFLMVGDGNSRLVSLWKARTGGGVDSAATALLRNVLGESADRPRDPRRVRAGITAMSHRINRGLSERELTEQTIREGHTATIPAVVIVGVVSDDDARPVDLVAAKDDLVAGLHVNTTPWHRAARYDQGMHRVLRSAIDTDLIRDPALASVLNGSASTQQMSVRLDLPPHPLWASATWVEQMTGKGRWPAVGRLFRQAFSLGQAQRKPIGERLGVVVLAPFRSRSDNLDVDRALNAFADGGPLTDSVLHSPWSLTHGRDPRTVLSTALDRALAGDVGARCELVVLGGTAAMLGGLLTRDRGSKLGTERADGKTPFRRTPHRLLESLATTPGGLHTLHSIALAFVLADGSQPKCFNSDGSPIMDRAGVQVTLDYEWDLFAIADPEATGEALRQATQDSDSRAQQDTRPEDERLRAQLANGLQVAVRAANGLTRLAQSGGNTVMGTPEFVEDSRRRAEAVRDILIRHTPRTHRPVLDDLDDDPSAGDLFDDGDLLDGQTR